MTAANSQDILDVLDSDANGIAALADKLASTTDSFDEQVEVVRLVREIVANHVAAEQYLNPLIIKHVPDGDHIAHKQFIEHREMETTLRRLEDLDVGSASFKAALTDIDDQWTANASYLSQEIFPQLRSVCDPAELARLGAAARGAEQSGPTRPRTFTAEEPAINTLLSMGQGFVDRIIDAYSHRGHQGSDELAQRIQSGHYDSLED